MENAYFCLAKERLSAYRNECTDLFELIQLDAAMPVSLYKSSSVVTGLKQKQSSASSTELGAERLIRLHDELDKQDRKCHKMWKYVCDLIDKSCKRPERTVLYYRYVNWCKFKNIAEIMHYNLRWVYRLHSRGLNEVALTIEHESNEDSKA
jgi:hypothetical protein